MDELLMPVPNNLSVDPSVRASLVSGDMFNICEQIKEIDPNLKVVHLVDGEKQSYVIMEYSPRTGQDEYVMRVSELDGRVLERLRYLIHVPFKDRVAELERANKAFEEAQHQERLDDLYERIGRPMWTQMEHDGFIETRNVSYPKRKK